MEKFDLYRDIRMRTGGEIYVGLVGPVRTGKSTFARNFAKQLILPNLEEPALSAVRDELPASASGKTVTTVEPKFIPRKAAQIPVGDGETAAVRLVDCVGFPVTGAEGMTEDGVPRMVRTPWQKEPVPFAEAARLGTRKVITDHATVGLVITTDGSFGELPRQSFLEAEKEAVRELQKLGKPFLLIVNSANPEGTEAKETAAFLKETYQTPVVIQNCSQPSPGDFRKILEQLLLEFPLTRVVFRIPRWVETLDGGHWLKQALFESARETMKKLCTIRDVAEHGAALATPYVRRCRTEKLNLADGSAGIAVEMQENLYFQILSEMTGADIRSEYQLISLVREMAAQRQEYEAAAAALHTARSTGYGVIPPRKEEIRMQEPSVFRQGSRYGVKIRAEAPSIHLIRADIRTEVSPVVGSEEQAQELITYIRDSGEEEAASRALIFGKSARELAEEGITAKLVSFGDDSRQRLQAALQKTVNGSKGRIIIIMI